MDVLTSSSTFDAFSSRSTAKMEPRIPPRLGRKVTQPQAWKAVPRESFFSLKRDSSTGLSSIGAGMLASGGGSLEDATLLDSEFLLGRPPSIYTPDPSIEPYALKYLVLANPDATSPLPSDSIVATRASSPSSYFHQTNSQSSSRYPSSINNPNNRRISRIPNFSRSSITVRLSSSSPPPLPPPSAKLPPPPAPSRLNYPYSYKGPPVASWGSGSDAYTFILPPKSFDNPSAPSNTIASSTLASSDLLSASAFPESPIPPSPSNTEHLPSSSGDPSQGEEVDEKSTALASKLPHLPPLTHKSSKSATRFEDLKLGGEGAMWVDSNGMAGGTKQRSFRGLSRSGTVSSSRTNGSDLDAEYEALEAYMEGRSWAK